jgi:hypothetical protein
MQVLQITMSVALNVERPAERRRSRPFSDRQVLGGEHAGIDTLCLAYAAL